jgi:hypothetical protein
MVRQRIRACAGVALLALLAWGLGGCWNPFAPPKGDPPPDPITWELRDSPQHVLDNLITAYKNKDAAHYLDCLAEDFIFFLNPAEVIEDPDLEPGYWGKAEERVVHEGMFGDGEFHADHITLTLSLIGDPISIEPHPGEIHWQYKEAVDLSVYVGDTQYWATAPSMFEFRIDQDQVGPNGETLWEIVNWYDLESTSREDVVTADDIESVSFGRAKAIFRP